MGAKEEIELRTVRRAWQLASSAEIKQAQRSKGQKAFITSGSPVVPLLSTSKADSGLASEF